MGILLCEQNFRDVWRRNKSVRAEIGKILRTHTHTHAAKLVVRVVKAIIIAIIIRIIIAIIIAIIIILNVCSLFTKLDRIRNERIRRTAKVGAISKKVQESRLKRYEHVLREAKRRRINVGKRVTVMEVPVKIRRGRPNRRCLDSMRND